MLHATDWLTYAAIRSPRNEIFNQALRAQCPSPSSYGPSLLHFRSIHSPLGSLAEIVHVCTLSVTVLKQETSMIGGATVFLRCRLTLLFPNMTLQLQSIVFQQKSCRKWVRPPLGRLCTAEHPKECGWKRGEEGCARWGGGKGQVVHVSARREPYARWWWWWRVVRANRKLCRLRPAPCRSRSAL